MQELVKEVVGFYFAHQAEIHTIVGIVAGWCIPRLKEIALKKELELLKAITEKE